MASQKASGGMEKIKTSLITQDTLAEIKVRGISKQEPGLAGESATAPLTGLEVTDSLGGHPSFLSLQGRKLLNIFSSVVTQGHAMGRD